MNIFSKMGVSIASMSLVATAFAPMAHAATVTVEGNGSNSTVSVSLKHKKKTTVSQSNLLAVTTFQSSSASTGGNKIKGTTGGDATIDTGNANSTNEVVVVGPTNLLTLPDSCGCDHPVDVTVSGNGSGSTTEVKLKHKDVTTLSQSNDVFVFTKQNSNASTGYNTVKNTTGGDENTITTGNATSGNSVGIEVGGNVINP